MKLEENESVWATVATRQSGTAQESLSRTAVWTKAEEGEHYGCHYGVTYLRGEVGSQEPNAIFQTFLGTEGDPTEKPNIFTPGRREFLYWSPETDNSNQWGRMDCRGSEPGPKTDSDPSRGIQRNDHQVFPWLN